MKDSRIWTALFVHKNGIYKGCFNVEIGHPLGQPIKEEVAQRLATKYKRGNASLSDYRLHCIVPKGRAEARF
jgi:hypothetical protein